MAKLFLFASSCLLALSVGTLLVSAGKHQHHPKKNAGHLSPVGAAFYKESVEFLGSAEEFLAKLHENKSVRQDQYGKMKKEYDEMISEVEIHEPNAKKAKKTKAQKEGEAAITQVEEESDEIMEHKHNFSQEGGPTHELTHKTLSDLKKVAREVITDAKILKDKTNVNKTETAKYHGLLNKLTAAMVKVEKELKIEVNQDGETDHLIDFSEGVEE